MVFPTICAHLHCFCSLLCGNPVLLQPLNSLQRWTDNSPSSHNNSCQLMLSFFYLLNFKEILLEGKALSNAPYTFPSPSVLVSTQSYKNGYPHMRYNSSLRACRPKPAAKLWRWQKISIKHSWTGYKISFLAPEPSFIHAVLLHPNTIIMLAHHESLPECNEQL